ncbi:MAG: hypothetical protein CME35_05105 [Gramella sp.]|nr:hypothetical protein [Christiangramia sp.]
MTQIIYLVQLMKNGYKILKIRLVKRVARIALVFRKFLRATTKEGRFIIKGLQANYAMQFTS